MAKLSLRNRIARFYGSLSRIGKWFVLSNLLLMAMYVPCVVASLVLKSASPWHKISFLGFALVFGIFILEFYFLMVFGFDRQTERMLREYEGPECGCCGYSLNGLCEDGSLPRICPECGKQPY